MFAVIKVAKEKKVTIRTFYFTKEANIWWNTVKDKFTCHKNSLRISSRELRAKFYPITVQQQKEKEFSELRMTENMTVMQYASKFKELS